MKRQTIIVRRCCSFLFCNVFNIYLSLCRESLLYVSFLEVVSHRLREQSELSKVKSFCRVCFPKQSFLYLSCVSKFLTCCCHNVHVSFIQLTCVQSEFTTSLFSGVCLGFILLCLLHVLGS